MESPVAVVVPVPLILLLFVSYVSPQSVVLVLPPQKQLSNEHRRIPYLSLKLVAWLLRLGLQG